MRFLFRPTMRKNNIICEFCGNEIYGDPFTIKVEGALLTVCSKCKQFGKVVEAPKKKVASASSSFGKPTVKRKTQSVRDPKRKYVPRKSSDEKTLVDNYSSKIMSARNKQKMSRQDLAAKTGISTSQIASFESGKLKPTDAEAKKLERVLKISLFEESMVDPEFLAKESSKKLTFGDIVEIKRK
ncbi:MAG: TIGR00270 family protein [Methanobacteriota archaeon]|nr:MAG: TIGR00270 family protein [Euryarchaeota archaeon]